MGNSAKKLKNLDSCFVGAIALLAEFKCRGVGVACRRHPFFAMTPIEAIAPPTKLSYGCVSLARRRHRFLVISFIQAITPSIKLN
jgi:hypothetical protein